MLSKYNFIMSSIVVIIILVIFVVFLVTFLVALKSIRANSDTKKQFRLTALFLAMFVVFILSFTPFIYVKAFSGGYVWEMLLSSTFMLTSIFNPALTLYFRKEFRITCRTRLSINEEIQIQQVRDLVGNNADTMTTS